MSGGRSSPLDLSHRFRERWEARGWSTPGARLLVACSGGVDSLTLLHLLRFANPPIEATVEAAIFDHRLRPESADEVRWLRGVAGAWGIHLHEGRAPRIPAGEEEARTLRYDFLESFLGKGFDLVLTAHHEDDQVETILFRILRGSGLDGVRGIPELRPPGILRPLLDISRAEIEEYARAHRLRPRFDLTNRELHPARNRVRLDLLPALERVHPGAREGLLRLARNADSAARALDHLLGPLMNEVVIEGGEEGSDGPRLLDRKAFLALEGPVRPELFRRVAGSLGIRLSEGGTAAALEFMKKGSSGTNLRLEGGLVLARDFDRVTLTVQERAAKGSAESRQGRERSRDGGGGLAPASATMAPAGVDSTGDRPLVIPDAGDGYGELILAGERFPVRWGRAPAIEGWDSLELDPAPLIFPLTLRGWLNGDRIRTGGGVKKLKKLFGELRVPVGDRGRTPLLVEAGGDVLWIAGRKVAAPTPSDTTGGNAGRSAPAFPWRVQLGPPRKDAR